MRCFKANWQMGEQKKKLEIGVDKRVTISRYEPKVT